MSLQRSLRPPCSRCGCRSSIRSQLPSPLPISHSLKVQVNHTSPNPLTIVSADFGHKRIDVHLDARKTQIEKLRAREGPLSVIRFRLKHFLFPNKRFTLAFLTILLMEAECLTKRLLGSCCIACETCFSVTIWPMQHSASTRANSNSELSRSTSDSC